jgi:hypothetical protein
MKRMLFAGNKNMLVPVIHLISFQSTQNMSLAFKPRSCIFAASWNTTHFSHELYFVSPKQEFELLLRIIFFTT